MESPNAQDVVRSLPIRLAAANHGNAQDSAICDVMNRHSAKEMERMSESALASGETKVYRLNLAYRLYHFAIGTAALVGAVIVFHFLILSVILALFGVFMISRPLVMAVTRGPVFRYVQKHVLAEFIAASLDNSG